MILITGGLGFIGTNLRRYLTTQGEDILSVDWVAGGTIFSEVQRNEKVKMLSCSILDLPGLITLMKDFGVDTIIHLAMLMEGRGTLHESLQVNIQGTINVLEAARINKLRRITFISSSAVYSDEKEGKHDEKERLAISSRSFIGDNKIIGEILNYLYKKRYGTENVIIRLPWVYGPMYKGTNPVRKMVEAAVRDEPIILDAAGEDEYEFLYVDDCVKGVSQIHLRKHLRFDIYNVGFGNSCSLNQVYEAIKKEVPSTRISFKNGQKEKPKKAIVLDISRVTQEVGYQPHFDIGAGVRAYIEWTRRNSAA
jgi:nucleoside-diphosphate-sugar epimerase